MHTSLIIIVCYFLDSHHNYNSFIVKIINYVSNSFHASPIIIARVVIDIVIIIMQFWCQNVNNIITPPMHASRNIATVAIAFSHHHHAHHHHALSVDSSNQTDFSSDHQTCYCCPNNYVVNKIIPPYNYSGNHQGIQGSVTGNQDSFKFLNLTFITTPWEVGWCTVCVSRCCCYYQPVICMNATVSVHHLNIILAVIKHSYIQANYLALYTP